jgi:hypothetical protein
LQFLRSDKKLDEVRGQGYKHHESYTNLYVSAQSGCEFCALIRDSQQIVPGGELTADWDHFLDKTQITIRVHPFLGTNEGLGEDRNTYDLILVGQLERPSSGKHLWVWFNLSTTAGEWRRVHWDVVANANEPDDPLADLIPRRLISTSPVSDECLDIASNWFQSCLEAHAECSENTGSPKLLPTRVIDIGLPNSNTSPVLLVSNGCFGDWITLSYCYCWGSFDSVKTTTATLKEHQASLPFESLPPLFRDAILLTRRFNYRYLWINALCILQDSEPDWRAEAANMGYIYRNSALTIAAECSSDEVR